MTIVAPDGAFTIGGGEWNFGQTMTEDLGKSLFMLPELTPDSVLTVLRLALERLPLDALKSFQTALGLAEGLFTDAGTAIQAILDAFVTKPIMQTVDAFNTWLTNTFGPMNTMFNQIVDVLRGAVVTPINTAVQEVIDWLNGLAGGSGGLSTVLTQFQTFLGTITNLSTWLDVLNTAINTFRTLFDSLGSGVWTVLSGVVTTFTTLFNALGATVWTVLGELITHFVGLFTGAGTVTTWLQDVLTRFSKLPSVNLIGQIRSELLGVLNIGHLTTEPINLILHPGFEDSTTVSPVDGWSWDSTTNATGSGGSAKVTLDGFNKELNHQSAVYVAPGDKMTVSSQFKSTGITGSWKAAVTVMEYRDGAIATPVEIVSRTTNAAGWVTLSGDYTVPAAVTAVVFRLVVEGATAGTAWFDDLNFHKSGILEQGWVQNLPSAWEDMWGGLMGTSGAGKLSTDMGTAVVATRAGHVGAQGSANTANNSHQLSWNNLYDAGVGNPAGTSTGQTAATVYTATNGHRIVSYGASGAATTANNSHTLNWNYLYDAHNGNTVGTSTGQTAYTSASAAAGHRGTTNGTLNNLFDAFNGAATSTTTGIAPGDLFTKTKVTQGAVDAATNNHTLMFNNLFAAFTGVPSATGQSAATVKAAATGVKTTQDNANTAVFGTTAPTATAKVQTSALPTAVTTVGSGIYMTKATGAYTTVLSGGSTATMMPWGFYDNTGTIATTDINVSNVGGYTCATVSNAGWYMVNTSFLLSGGADLVNFAYHWGFTPGICKSSGTTVPPGTFHRAGPTQVCVVDSFVGGANSWTGDIAAGSWIVYLNANETVYPAYYCSREGSATSATIIKNGGFIGLQPTSFSMSLLNRSLA